MPQLDGFENGGLMESNYGADVNLSDLRDDKEICFLFGVLNLLPGSGAFEGKICVTSIRCCRDMAERGQLRDQLLNSLEIDQVKRNMV